MTAQDTEFQSAEEVAMLVTEGTDLSKGPITFSEEAKEGLMEALGTRSASFLELMLNQIIDMLPARIWGEQRQVYIDAAIAAIRSEKPTTEIETMNLSLIIACQYMSMDRFKQANRFSFDSVENGIAINQALKFARTFNQLQLGFNKSRGKGVTEQKVIVQHVNVSEGGQAIVGDVKKGS